MNGARPTKVPEEVQGGRRLDVRSFLSSFDDSPPGNKPFVRYLPTSREVPSAS